MNNLAFQIYGTKKATPFQSVWDTTTTSAVGTELANITGTGTNWAAGGASLVSGGYNHTSGSASVLQFSLAAIAGQSYQMKYTVTGTGYVVINFGGVSSAPLFAGTDVIITMTPITAATLSITPLPTFVGNISLSIKQSSSATNQIQLPISSIASGKSVWIDWGDGQYSTANNSNYIINRIHTYSVQNTYTVRVFGDDFSFAFGDTSSVNDRLKIKSISSWGKLKLGASSFNGCSNVTMSGITDVPDLTGVTDLSTTFARCSLLTTVGRMNEWNTSSVTLMGGMFFSTPIFNQPIDNWNVSNVISMGSMFSDAPSFNQPLANWERNTLGNTSTLANVTSMNNMFGGAGTITRSFNQNIGSWNVSKVTDFTQFFGAGNSNSLFNNGGSPSINNWSINTLQPVSFASMFNRCINFNQPIGSWNVSQVTNMGNMFKGTTAFNSNLGTGTTPWDVSKVTTFASMFNGASNFRNGDDTAPINNWNIGGSVTGTINMASMFQSASNFNRAISSWNMTKVINTSSMFYQTSAFNQPLANWERNGSTLANVTNMESMFQNIFVFNQPIGNWNVSGVTNMYQMFNFTTAFNQDISSWNVGKVTTFASMFNGATAFNNGGNSGIDGWNIGTTATSVNIGSMFRFASAFNQPLGSWNVTKVTDMSNMFDQAIAFNQPLANWERNGSTLANVTNMFAMFYNATAFNQPLGSWNVTKVTSVGSMFYLASNFNNGLLSGVPGSLPWVTTNCTNMSYMFKFASKFNQCIGTFDVSNITTFVEMLNGASVFNNGDNSTSMNSWNINTISNVTMANMFYSALAFNNPIDNWNMTKVTNTAGMFGNTRDFNQELSNWERTGSTLANVTSMNNMFSEPGSFNKNIGNWNVSKVTDFSAFMRDKTPANFSSTNLDAIYNGWIVNGVKPNISSPLATNISFGTAKYSQAGRTGKDTLLASPNNWRITDGLLTVSGTSSNGGLIRVTTATAHGFVTGNSVYIYGVGGTTNANGTWTVTVISTTVIQLQGSIYNGAYVINTGNVILP